MYRLFKAKKGVAVDDFFSLLFVVIVFVIFILVFAVFNTNKDNEAKKSIEEKIDKIDGNYNLLQFLRTPIDDKDNVADLVVESYLNDDFDEFRDTADNFFNDIYEPNWWKLQLDFPDGTTKSFGGYGAFSTPQHTCVNRVLIAKTDIPLINFESLTVNLFSLELGLC